MRYELSDHEWTAIKPMLPKKPCGVPRVNDRRILNGIFWVIPGFSRREAETGASFGRRGEQHFCSEVLKCAVSTVMIAFALP